ncbi:TPM domain-containing protein [Joostella sp. CR20]|uniref:TPM domain-containing protein n=1 Tax=Joostella sp. CR20 TaxID=2804312 RepID=UPI00313C9D85
MQKQKIVFLLFLFGCIFLQSIHAQFDIPKKPNIETSVFDYANVLSSSEKTALEQKLINYADTTSTQIVIATVPTINGEYIGTLAPKWAHEWGVGQAKEDNGVFILLTEQERKIWIAPGYGLEQKLTAGINGEIIRNVIIPEFKTGNYYSGLNKGTDALIQLFAGTYKGTPQARKNNSTGSGGFGAIIFIFFVFIIILIIFSKNNRGGGNGGNRTRKGGGLDLLDMIILSNMGRGGGNFGGGGFGGSSGGGFGGGGFGGGFGGGGFSGGGAGGSW